jgi:eukaryotic-like serine/threonine-protein kinase
MGLGKYLVSRVFFMQILVSIVIIAAIGFLFTHWLTFATNHGDVIEVPNLAKMNTEQAEDKLDDVDLEMVVLDTIDYIPDFPKMSVIDQDPLPGAQVKEGRKVYVKLNANGFATVKIPDLIQHTYRQAVPTLKALGLSEGVITYTPDIGKDMVLKMSFNGKELKTGDKVLKASKIDLVLGDGKIVFEEELDSTNTVIPEPVEEKPKNE